MLEGSLIKERIIENTLKQIIKIGRQIKLELDTDRSLFCKMSTKLIELSHSLNPICLAEFLV